MEYLILTLIIIVQIFCLTLIYTWIQNEEAEMLDKYNSGYEAGIMFHQGELWECRNECMSPAILPYDVRLD